MQNDLRLDRYKEITQESLLFMEEGMFSDAIARSLFRVMKIEYYMSDDFILNQDATSDLYLVLDGEVKVKTD